MLTPAPKVPKDPKVLLATLAVGLPLVGDGSEAHVKTPLVEVVRRAYQPDKGEIKLETNVMSI